MPAIAFLGAPTMGWGHRNKAEEAPTFKELGAQREAERGTLIKQQGWSATRNPGSPGGLPGVGNIFFCHGDYCCYYHY